MLPGRTVVTVYEEALLAAPRMVTMMEPVVAPVGTRVMMLVLLQLTGVAAVPLNVTVLVPCVGRNCVPVIVTMSVTCPVDGLTEVIVGGGRAVVRALTARRVQPP